MMPWKTIEWILKIIGNVVGCRRCLGIMEVINGVWVWWQSERSWIVIHFSTSEAFALCAIAVTQSWALIVWQLL